MSARTAQRRAKAPLIERGKIPDLARMALYTGFDSVSSEAHRIYSQVGGSDDVRLRISRKLYRRFLQSLAVLVRQQERVWNGGRKGARS